MAIAAESHPFPSRTRKLSLPAPMVLGGCPLESRTSPEFLCTKPHGHSGGGASSRSGDRRPVDWSDASPRKWTAPVRGRRRRRQATSGHRRAGTSSQPPARIGHAPGRRRGRPASRGVPWRDGTGPGVPRRDRLAPGRRDAPRAGDPTPGAAGRWVGPAGLGDRRREFSATVPVGVTGPAAGPLDAPSAEETDRKVETGRGGRGPARSRDDERGPLGPAQGPAVGAVSPAGGPGPCRATPGRPPARCGARR